MHRLHDVLNQRNHLRRLRQRLAQYAGVLERVRGCLISPLDQQVLAAVLRDGQLTLFTGSPVWASRLRYMAPQMQKSLRQQGLVANRILVRITPPSTTVETKPRRQAKGMSEQSSESLRLTAETLKEGDLKEALMRLSRHLSRE
ncbi:MAG: DciA family protein [Candidatus Thiodiazotropha sp.]